MKNEIKKKLKFLLLTREERQILRLKKYFNEIGWFESTRELSAIDLMGRPLPWFTYPAIEYISQFNFDDKNILEWGAGNSSAFFSGKGANVYSIEDNKEWYKRVKNLNLKNHNINLVSEDNYAQIALKYDIPFDIIIIDGKKREECCEVALQLILDNGIIILDNSDRHQEIAAKLRSRKFTQVDFHGLGPINNYAWTTSVFLNRKTNLVPNIHQPVVPIGGGF